MFLCGRQCNCVRLFDDSFVNGRGIGCSLTDFWENELCWRCSEQRFDHCKKVEFHWFSGRIAAFLYSRLTDVILHSMEIYCSLFEFGKMNFVEEIKSNVLVSLIIEFN